MYAIVKTGGKQYKVAPGDTLNVEKLPGEVGDTVTLDAICVIDGKKVEADPAKAAATKVEAIVVEQFKDDKVLVFKFKKRKNYKKLRGHRQQLTRVQITSVGSEKYTAPKKKAAPKAKKDAEEAASESSKKTTAKATTKSTATKAASKTTKKAAEKTTEAKPKATAKKATAKTTKTTKAKEEKATTTADTEEKSE